MRRIHLSDLTDIAAPEELSLRYRPAARRRSQLGKTSSGKRLRERHGGRGSATRTEAFFTLESYRTPRRRPSRASDRRPRAALDARIEQWFNT
jgi:hypothetical protein